MNWLQIRLFGPYFSSFSTNSYGYYSQKSQNLFSNGQIFVSAQIVRQAASAVLRCVFRSTGKEYDNNRRLSFYISDKYGHD